MKFYLDGNFFTLNGDKSQLPTPAQYNHINKISRTRAIAKLYTLQLDLPIIDSDHWVWIPRDLEPDLAILLHTYMDVFSVPQGFPPNKTQDHSILLLKDVKPVKVRPYMYPHSQKSQIKKMISDMLDEGLIVPINSPFSSSIFLVKKKDET